MGKVSPNPIVGAVIARSNSILGEGYHKRYGTAHAEVMALKSALKKNVNNFNNSSIYVSLEPCNFYGKTPPCSELIIQQCIPKVIVSAIDQTEQVNSSSLQKLRDHGHTVLENIKPLKGKFTARFRNTFATKKRPYIILKFAQSKDGFMGKKNEQIWLSNSFSKRLTHRWRSEVSAILAGTNTILTDDPELTTRHYTGSSPLRIAIDLQGKISQEAKIKNEKALTWIYTNTSASNTQQIEYRTVKDTSKILTQICSELYDAKHHTLMVEGGPATIASFIQAGLWDEARIIHTPVIMGNGLKSPQISGIRIAKKNIDTDSIELIMNPKNVIYS